MIDALRVQAETGRLSRSSLPGLLTVLRAFARVLVVVWAASTVGFFALMVIPGDPVDVMLGVQAQVSEGVRENIRAQWGLDQPPLLQYLDYLARLAVGDLGKSYQLRTPVVTVISQQLVPTLQLSGAALVVACGVAVITALTARGRWSSRVISLLELIAISSPTFWTGLVLLSVFSFSLGWFPATSSEGLRSLILPAITLALPVAGIISQVLRQGLDHAETQPFVLTARSRGISPARLVSHHTGRHAAMDSLTLSGYLVGAILGGSVLVETVFARPGLGQVTIRAIIGRDLPVILGLIVLSALIFAIINLLVDYSYRMLDPRLRRPGRQTGS